MRKVSLNSFVNRIQNQFIEDLSGSEVYCDCLEYTCSMTELSLSVIQGCKDRFLTDYSYLDDFCNNTSVEEDEQWLELTKKQKIEIVKKAYSNFLKEFKIRLFQKYRCAVANTISDDDIALELGMKLVNRYMGNSKKMVKTYILSKGSK